MKRIGPYLFTSPSFRPVYKHGMALVYARRVMSASRRVRKTGAVPVFGIDAGEVGRGQREAAFPVLDGGGVVQEEGAVGLIEASRLPTENESAKLETRIHIGEEGRQVRCLRRRFSKVKQPTDAPTGGNGLEEAGRGLVSINTGGGEQADDAVRLDSDSWRFSTKRE